MFLFIDPVIYFVHGCDAKYNDLHDSVVHMERSMGGKQRTAFYRDGEWVCAVVQFLCWPAVPSPLS